MIFALFASTSAFMPFIKVPPIAVPACNIAITGAVSLIFCSIHPFVCLIISISSK